MKRYESNSAMSISVVKDLYGSMVETDAVRGVLVTTSRFSSKSLEFAKDKPLTLIDGKQLIELLEQNGFGVFNITPM